jgi:exodeoxyribonuclease VII large subunit
LLYQVLHFNTISITNYLPLERSDLAIQLPLPVRYTYSVVIILIAFVKSKYRLTSLGMTHNMNNMSIFGEKTILTVSRVTTLLRGVLEENFEQLWVQGEASNLTFTASGHLYFILKDAAAQLKCVMFKSGVRNLKFRPEDGMELIIRGRISVYDQRGEYQLVCEYIEPAGVGALQAAFMQLKDRLAKEGLFEGLRKRPMPRFPHRLGVVTSPTGAAIHDILNVLKRRFASLEILLYPVKVQGKGAAEEISEAVDNINRLGLVDVIIVGRGGGSLEDLWAFNEECVARAVHRSNIPVISAVGHETDWTICDFTADLRAPTPSAAAEMVISSTDEIRSQLESLNHRIRLTMELQIAALESRVDFLRRALHDPRTMLGHLAQRLDDLMSRLDQGGANTVAKTADRYFRLNQSLLFNNPVHSVNRGRQLLLRLYAEAEHSIGTRVETFKIKFAGNAARLDVLSPLSTLQRGYSIATTIKYRRVISSASDLSAGERLRLRFARGTATALVESVENHGQ